MNDMGLIYRYKDIDNTIIYVGKVTGNTVEAIQKRIKSHKHYDEWAKKFSGIVEYLKLPEKYLPLSKASTDALETHFINKFYSNKSNNKNYQVGIGMIPFLASDVENAKWTPVPINKNDTKNKIKPKYMQAPYTPEKKGQIIANIKNFSGKLSSLNTFLNFFETKSHESANNNYVTYNTDASIVEIKIPKSYGDISFDIGFIDKDICEICLDKTYNTVSFILGNHFKNISDIKDTIIQKREEIMNKALNQINFLCAHYDNFNISTKEFGAYMEEGETID